MIGRAVWAVTSGEYDSWDVVCLFETEAEADAAVAAGVGDAVVERRLYGQGEMPRKAELFSANATVTTDPIAARALGWRADSDPWVTGPNPTWTHLESIETELTTSHNLCRMWGHAIGEDRDAALAAVTEWQRQERAALDDRHRAV